MKTFLFASALLLAGSPAFAQPVVDRALRAPSLEAAAAPAAEAPLPVPDLPAVPPAIAARVTSLRAVVDESRECFTYRGERDEHIADRRCPGWFASLQRGGEAGAHAIGASLDADFRGHEIDFENVGNGAWLVRPRIMRLMAASGGATAATYLVRYVGRALSVDHGLNTESARAAFDTLAAMAGEDLTRVAPWEDTLAYEDRERMTAAVQRWLRWRRDVSTLPTAEQSAIAARHNAEALASSDPAQRLGAIQRMVTVPAQRAAAVASLRELVASPGLSAEGRSYVVRWARRQRIPVTVPRAAAR
ncbi:MAG: hypothetical protein EPO40_37235 [Myxococcaceae bacterium]|nr:MAG: hypothetical protein EPO40_37235 [Myxococcaceae bacterium]